MSSDHPLNNYSEDDSPNPTEHHTSSDASFEKSLDSDSKSRHTKTTSKKPTPYIVVSIICLILAIAGVGFGAYTLISTKSEPTQSNYVQTGQSDQTAQSEPSLPPESTSELEASAARPNPIPIPASGEVYRTFSLIHNPITNLDIYLGINNGEIDLCNLQENQQTIGTCTISGLDQRIYKAASVTIGQNYSPSDIFAFLLEDGTVAYMYPSQITSGVTNFTIDGILPIDGTVRDMFAIQVFPADSPVGGGYTFLFVLDDGTVIDYRNLENSPYQQNR